jgi:branched-chain amino acid transport system permease protein
MLTLAVLYLPILLTDRSIFGYRLSNMQLLNIGMTQVNATLIMALGAMSLTYLTGRAGLISVGHAALFAVGAMTSAIVGTQWGWSFPVVLVACAVSGALAGVIAGLPSLRVRGLYFLISTLALHYIVIYTFAAYQDAYFDVVGVRLPEPLIFGHMLDSQLRWYYFLLVIVVLALLGMRNSLNAREGRALMALRDHELAATAAGVDVRLLRLKAFAFTSAIASVAGALYAYYLGTVSYENFGINFAIQFIAMIIIGGMGSLGGAIVGAILWVVLPSVITGFVTQAQDSVPWLYQFLVNGKPQLVQLIFGVLVIVFLIWAPGGIADLVRKRIPNAHKEGKK